MADLPNCSQPKSELNMIRFLNSVLKVWFWFSGLTLLLVALYAPSAKYLTGLIWTPLDAVYMLVFGGPLIALNLLLTNLALLGLSSGAPKWKRALICQLMVYAAFVALWLIFP